MNTVEFTNMLNSMTYDQYLDTLNRFGIPAVENTESNEYLAKYALQGEREGIEPNQIPFYASKKLVDLFNSMPYLATKHQKVVDTKPAKIVKAKIKATKSAKVTQPATESKPAQKAPKAAKPAKVRHADFAIVARPDRGGYEGWVSGRAEAFRPTVEKVQAFFQKKYGQEGFVV